MNIPHTLRVHKGFTVVELLIVIVVIGILAGIVIVSYGGTQNRANKSSFSATAQQVKLKLGDYFTDNNKYPTTKAPVGTAGTVLKYLSDVGGGTSSALVTEFTKSAYVYTASPSGCDNSATPCTGYTITVAKSAWGNASVTSDSDITVGP